MPDILRDLGDLFLGSRFKRLAERLQGDAARVVKSAGLPLQPAQIPLLAALDRYGAMTVNDATATLGVSQPVVTRTLASLVELGLIETTREEADLRHKTLALTPAGKAMLARAKALVWPRVESAVRELRASLSGDLLQQLDGLEKALDARSLEERVNAVPPGLVIREYEDALAADFYRINAEWIESMFRLEENDIRILSQPRELIIDRGGVILFVETADVGVVGACALIKTEEGCFELTKMGVTEAARGRKAGEALLAAILERARTMEMETLYLLTNHACAPAIHLYEKLGFVHDAAIMERFGKRYARCDVAMSYAIR